MNKIGFIDYYISEWHANKYSGWIREANRGFEVAYAYAELDVSPVDGVTTDEWCTKYNAERCFSIEELCEKSDFIIILSPDNPEKHLDYAKAALRCGKPCYIDKTFAFDTATAAEIFDEAEKYSVRMFSSSALRYAAELDEADKNIKGIAVSGGGNFDHYLVHFVEIAVKLMGISVKSVICASTGNYTWILEYTNGRSAVINMYCAKGSPSFEVSIETMSGEKIPYIRIKSDFFAELIKNILDLFDGNVVPVSPDETMAVVAIIEAARKASAEPFRKIEVCI